VAASHGSFWLLSGKARLKQGLAEGVTLDCASLPYTGQLLSLLEQAHAPAAN
jgi:hypothetical protein